MNVVLIGMDWFPNFPGGLNRYFYEQIEAFSALGVEGLALVSELKPGQSATMPLEAMAPLGAGMRTRWRGARNALGSAIGHGAELVNAHFAMYAYGCLPALPKNFPLVVHFHGPWAAEIAAERTDLRGRVRAAVARHMEKKVYARADRVITLSQAFADLLCRDYAVDRGKVRVVPGGLNLDEYLSAPPRNEARARLDWPQNVPILLSVRRLVRRVGLERLIDAMPAIRAAVPEALLYIGGEGPLRAELENRIRNLGLGKCIKLLGFVPHEDLPAAYAAADLAVTPTLSLEGFGLVTTEALAAGTPVVGTPVGGTPEILRGLNPALVTSSAECTALAGTLIAALTRRLALPGPEQCRAHAKQFAWDRVAPAILDVFHEAIATRSPATPQPAA